MKLKEVISQLGEMFNISQAEDFDNVGLLCGNPEIQVSGILVSHDAIEKTVDEAIEKNKNLIVAFHPILFSGLKSITGKNYVERALLKAIENRIAIYAVHTAFDNDYYGVNYRISEILGLKNQKILLPKSGEIQQIVTYVEPEYTEQVKKALFEAGAGKIGLYHESSFKIEGEGTFLPMPGAKPVIGAIGKREKVAEHRLSFIFEKHKKNQILDALFKGHPYDEVAYEIYSLENDNTNVGLGRVGILETPMSEMDFLSFVKEKLRLKMIRHSSFNNKKIEKVGILGGSGASAIQAAVRQNCDAYLTGDIKYHDFFQHENKTLICDIGHYESEQFVVEQLFEKLSEKFTKFAVLKSTENTNPVNYFL